MVTGVAPRPLVPPELTRGPFTLADAMRAGLTRWHLRGKAWRSIGSGMYVWSGLPDSPMRSIAAAHARLPAGAIFSGRTAAWLHDLDVPQPPAVEVTVPPEWKMSARERLAIRRASLAADEVVTRRDMPVTSILRTLLDLGQTLPPVEAVVVADMALHGGLVSLDEFQAAVKARQGTRNVSRLRRLAELVDPAAESAMESRLRTMLVLAGLPRPAAQVSLYDPGGRFLARADLYYPAARLVLEYDGATHRESLVADNRRQNRLLSAGYRLLRFTAADVLGRPGSIVELVRAQLAQPELIRPA